MKKSPQHSGLGLHRISAEQAANEAREPSLSTDRIEKINQEQEDLNKSKQEIELKIKVWIPLIYDSSDWNVKNLEQQKSEEENLIKKKQVVNNLLKQVEEGTLLDIYYIRWVSSIKTLLFNFIIIIT